MARSEPACRGWRFRRITVDPSDTNAIRKLVEEGIRSADHGKLKPAKEVFDRLERKYRAQAQARKPKARR